MPGHFHLPSSSSSTSSDDEDTDIDSDSEFITPKKKRRSSRYHGLTSKRAEYYKKHLRNLKTGETSTLASTSTTTSAAVADVVISMLSSLSGTSSSDEESESSITSENVESDTSTTESDEDLQYHIEFEDVDHTDISDEEVQRLKMFDNILFEGSLHTKLSLYTVVMMYVIKHSLSKEAFSDLLLIIESVVPKSCKLKTSVYKVKDDLKNFVELQDPKKHFFCENCGVQLERADTNCTCLTEETKVLEYDNLNLEYQISKLFEDNYFSEMVMKKRDFAPQNCWKDICDGLEYKRLIPRNFNERELHLTFTVNTDGVSVFSSSKKGNLWPIYLAINELPVKVRFSRKYLIPCYMHCQVGKPNMLTYLSDLMKVFQKFESEGIRVITVEGEKVVKGHLLAACLDLPARALVSNMKQFNGKFACNVCFDEGKARANAPMHIFYPFQEVVQLRTRDSVFHDARIAATNRQAERGFKGASALMSLKYTDMTKVFPVDWMHCVLLGVVKYLMNLWLGSSYRDKPFYIGDKITLLNQRLLGIKFPDFVAHKPRSLEEAQHWKGDEKQTMNVHMLRHIPHYVKLYGPLFNFSCFGFESMNNCLKKMIHGTGHVNSQITFAVGMTRCLPTLVKQIVQKTSSNIIKKLFTQLSSKITREEGTHRNNSSRAVGKAVAFQVDNDHRELVEPILRWHDLQDTKLEKLYRWHNADEKYTCREYKESKTRNNYCVAFLLNDYATTCYGTLQFYLRCGEMVYVVIEKFKMSGSILSFMHTERSHILDKYARKSLCSHMQKVDYDEKVLVPAKNIQKKCIFMKRGGEMFISCPPNLLEHS